MRTYTDKMNKIVFCSTAFCQGRLKNVPFSLSAGLNHDLYLKMANNEMPLSAVLQPFWRCLISLVNYLYRKSTVLLSTSVRESLVLDDEHSARKQDAGSTARQVCHRQPDRGAIFLFSSFLSFRFFFCFCLVAIWPRLLEKHLLLQRAL